MKYTRKDLSDTKIQLTVELNDKELADVKRLALAHMSENLKVPGFRQGKVPAAVAEKHLDATALAEHMAQDAVNKSVIDALEAEKVQPLDRPQVEVAEFKPDQKLVYTAEVEILPTVVLGDYKKLKAEKPKITIAAKDVNEVIERMQKGFAEKAEVSRPAKDGDEVWIDFEGTDKDGKAVAGASGTDYPLALGSSTFIPGFEEGLAGKKNGDEFDLPLTFPKDYHHKPLAGSKVNFKVKVKKVTEVALPKLDDEFAKKAGPFKTAKELKDDVKRELKTREEQNANEQLKDKLVEQLVINSKIPVPEVLVEDQMKNLERDTEQNLMYRGQTLDQYLESQNLTKEEWQKKELKEAAKRRVQVGLALSELSKAEKIEVTQDELEARLQEMLQQYNDPKIRSQIDTPDARRSIANRVLTEKTIDRLVELNTR
jgi:trigger factor